MVRKVFDCADGMEYPFIAYFPQNVKKKLPIIIQLHGAGEAGNGGEELELTERYGFSDFFGSGERECILVLPKCSPNSFWVAEIQKLYSFIKELENYFDIDRNRIYLTGLSMGGYGTWFLAMAYPDIFAAIAPVCGGGMIWKAPALNMPVWAFHGTEDELVLPSESINMIHALRLLGKKDVKLTMLDGVAHNAWTYAYNKELFEWFMSKRKGENYDA